MRAFTQIIHRLKPRAKLNYTVSELHHCITYSVKNTFLYGKNDCHNLEKVF